MERRVGQASATLHVWGIFIKAVWRIPPQILTFPWFIFPLFLCCHGGYPHIFSMYFFFVSLLLWWESLRFLHFLTVYFFSLFFFMCGSSSKFQTTLTGLTAQAELKELPLSQVWKKNSPRVEADYNLLSHSLLHLVLPLIRKHVLYNFPFPHQPIFAGKISARILNIFFQYRRIQNRQNTKKCWFLASKFGRFCLILSKQWYRRFVWNIDLTSIYFLFLTSSPVFRHWQQWMTTSF